MNKERRLLIQKATVLLGDAKAALDDIKDAEQAYFDAMPENLQEGDKGVRAEGVIEQLDDAMNSIDEALSSCDDAAL